jgi:hypothetical protein
MINANLENELLHYEQVNQGGANGTESVINRAL